MFAHRLAIELHCPMKEILAMSLSEYVHWLEYFSRVQNEGKANLAEMDPKQVAAAFGANVS